MPPVYERIDVAQREPIVELGESYKIVSVLAQAQSLVEVSGRVDNTAAKQRGTQAQVRGEAAIHIGKTRRYDCVIFHAQTKPPNRAIEFGILEQGLKQQPMTSARP